ncbi:MAG: ribonuclease H-like domain-containing protein [Candidatus Sumerlaeota bacterium]
MTDYDDIPLTLEEAVPGDVLTVEPYGEAWLVHRYQTDVAEYPQNLSEVFAERLQDPSSPMAGWMARLCEGLIPSPEDFVFFDLETTGLRFTPLFLVGAMVWENGQFAIHQYFARDLSEEAAAIALYEQLACDRKILVSFNGKSFDQPFIESRGRELDLAIPRPILHIDLLHLGRRMWGRNLPNCKLQTLERYILNRPRDESDDIPSRLIPQTYKQYVQTGDARNIRNILHHNRLDLLTLAELLIRLPAP